VIIVEGGGLIPRIDLRLDYCSARHELAHLSGAVSSHLIHSRMTRKSLILFDRERIQENIFDSMGNYGKLRGSGNHLTDSYVEKNKARGTLPTQG